MRPAGRKGHPDRFLFTPTPPPTPSHPDDIRYRFTPTPPPTPRRYGLTTFATKSDDSYKSPRGYTASSGRHDYTISGSDTSRRSYTRDGCRSGRSRSYLDISNVDWASTDKHKSRYIANYIYDWGYRVVISEPLNPWRVLGLHSSDVSYGATKAAFKMKITQPGRQNRAMVSIANHMLTTSGDRYTRKHGTDEYIVRKQDHFILAACGDTRQLEHEIAKKENLVADRDEHGRTLLYTASKSGFCDTCKMLLQKGADIDEAQRDGSTPLHAASYFGHEQVVRLLLQYSARHNIRNKFGNTALNESATSEIQRLIQSASTDQISSLAVELREKQLVSNVRLIEYQGEVIAKELIRDPRVLDERTRREWNTFHLTWELAWHGTRYAYLTSIIQKGLLPSGSSGINPETGHFRLGEEHFGVPNWAAAIFVSPSILYAAHEAYSERVFSESKEWCVLVKVYCKPGAMKSYDPTVLKYEPMEGEPDAPEYRVPVNEADKNVILRVESRRNVVVRSLMFVRVSFLKNQDINFQKVVKLLH